jgi:hypothetical protein
MRLEAFGESGSSLTPGEFVSIVILAGVLHPVMSVCAFSKREPTRRSLVLFKEQDRR